MEFEVILRKLLPKTGEAPPPLTLDASQVAWLEGGRELPLLYLVSLYRRQHQIMRRCHIRGLAKEIFHDHMTNRKRTVRQICQSAFAEVASKNPYDPLLDSVILAYSPEEVTEIENAVNAGNHPVSHKSQPLLQDLNDLENKELISIQDHGQRSESYHPTEEASSQIAKLQNRFKINLRRSDLIIFSYPSRLGKSPVSSLPI